MKRQNRVTNEFFAHRKDAPACRQAGRPQRRWFFGLAVKGRRTKSLRFFAAKVLF